MSADAARIINAATAVPFSLREEENGRIFPGLPLFGAFFPEVGFGVCIFLEEDFFAVPG